LISLIISSPLFAKFKDLVEKYLYVSLSPAKHKEAYYIINDKNTAKILCKNLPKNRWAFFFSENKCIVINTLKQDLIGFKINNLISLEQNKYTINFRKSANKNIRYQNLALYNGTNKVKYSIKFRKKRNYSDSIRFQANKGFPYFSLSRKGSLVSSKALNILVINSQKNDLWFCSQDLVNKQPFFKDKPLDLVQNKIIKLFIVLYLKKRKLFLKQRALKKRS